MHLHQLVMTQSGAVKQAKGLIMFLSLPGQVKTCPACTQLSMSQKAFELLLVVIVLVCLKMTTNNKKSPVLAGNQPIRFEA